MVRQENRLAVVAHAHLVGILDTAHGRGGKSVTDLHAFDRVDPHQPGSKVSVELAIDRCSKARRNAFSYDLDHRAAGGPRLADTVEILLEEFRLLGVGAEKRILADLVPVPARPVDLVRAHLHQGAPHRQPVFSSVKTPDILLTASGSCRCVVKRDWPGRRRSSSRWMSSTVSRIRGGHPSTTQPI